MNRTFQIARPALRGPAGGLLVLALAACHQGGGGQGDAPAPVLSGTISDAMLPVDQLTSQPPLDPRAVRSAAAAAGAPDAEASDAAPDGAAPAADASPQPAPPPAVAPAVKPAASGARE